MLPALLAYFTDKSGSASRKEVLECVEVRICTRHQLKFSDNINKFLFIFQVYIKDFITRLKNYGILSSGNDEFNVIDVSSTAQNTTALEDSFRNATRNRAEKVKL